MANLQLPMSHKKWKSLNDREIFPSTWAAVDADRMFIRFMELCMRSGGATLQIKGRSPADLEFFIDYLVQCGDIGGLDTESRKEIVSGWIESSLVVWQGKSKQRDPKNRQMAYFRPVTLGVIRACLQADGNDIRYSDLVTYRSCLEDLKLRGVITCHSSLRNLVHKTLGEGIVMSSGVLAAGAEPKYDEHSSIDISALLAMRLLRLFTDARPNDPIISNPQETWPSPTWVPDKRRRPVLPSGISHHALLDFDNSPIASLVFAPEAFAPIGRDLVSILQSYSNEPQSTLTELSIALASLRLFQEPLIVADALSSLIREKDTSDESVSTNLGVEARNLEMYCDFTNGADLGSLELAKNCVQRDIEKHRRLVADRLHLRVLDHLGSVLSRGDVANLAAAKASSHRDYVALLFEYYRQDKFDLAGNFLYQEFKSSVSDSSPASENSDQELNQAWRDVLDEIDEIDVDGVTKFLKVLKLGKSPGYEALEKQIAWFRTSGGLLSTPPHKSYGLLSGTVKARSTWCYSPSDSLVKALLLGCFIDDAGSLAQEQIRLSELLVRLEQRFGILVSRPPRELNYPNNIRAAAFNQKVFVRRLRLLGCYEGLSDDPTYQYVTRPGVAGLA